MKPEYDFSKAKRGPIVPPDPNKVRVTLPLDPKILNHFRKQVDRAGGGDLRILINDVLLDYIRAKKIKGRKQKAVAVREKPAAYKKTAAKKKALPRKKK